MEGDIAGHKGRPKKDRAMEQRVRESDGTGGPIPRPGDGLPKSSRQMVASPESRGSVFNTGMVSLVESPDIGTRGPSDLH